MVTLSTADIVLIAAYFLAVLLIGFLSSNRNSDATEFLVAGRTLTLPIFVMTLVSTWYGGILGVGEFSYLYGISNWIVQGVPYYIFAVVFALFLATKIRSSNLLTIPDKLHQAYDRKTAVLGSLLTFILMTPAPYMLMIAVLLQLITGWSILACILVGTFATTVYLFFGGFRSDVNTDAFEFVLMFVGFGIIIPFAYAKFGGFDFIQQHVPPLHLTWNGGNSIQFVLVWFFIALWTLVDPAFHQRCYAAKSGAVARKGILISIGFWFLFDALTATAGLYARAALPSIAQPIMAYPLLAEATLPPIAKGLFYIGMFATIMSTLNSLAFISATTLGRDIVWRMSRGRSQDAITNEAKQSPQQGSVERTGFLRHFALRDHNDSVVTYYTRAGLILTAALSILLCLLIPSVIKLWYTIGTIVIPGLLIPLVTSYFEKLKVTARFAFGAMLFGWLTSLGWLSIGWSREIGSSAFYPFGIEPMYPGLLVSLAVWVLGLRIRNQELRIRN